ncbi:UDP-glycosyltransferase UGT5 isoform X1 [Dendroctonus ponderosae]|uniref:UDP-glucuronosyltransferase n=1 Tax=Dendroctonus ponderosae TaxID=77166 RepID=A0AAR5P4X5_DENPD|nr:UDP-glycosyltransferase UGT5 isoform X1 [Dendroctonus ponderosae]
MNLHLIMQLSACLLLLVIKSVNGAKVLFFCPVPAHSHQKMYTAVWKEMSFRGHKVFVVTPNPAFNKSMVNLTEYDISSVYEFQRSQIKPEWKETVFKKPTFLGLIARQIVIQYVGGDGMEFLYQHAEVKRLVKEHNNFDICLFEWFHPALAIYGHLFNCPVVGLGSNSLPIQMLDSVGNPSHPITAPEQDLPIPRMSITFFQRVWSTFWTIFARLQHKYFLVPMEDARIRRYYGSKVPYLGDLEKNISLLILNRNPAFHRPIPNGPNVIELGSIQYKWSNITFDPDLKQFLDNSNEGVVYFSLGVSMEGTSMPPRYLGTFQAAFRKLPFQVLWKWENSSMHNKPDNVLIAKFVPQVLVLQHPNVKLFITQGGLQSTEEAIAAHKPIIGIPFHSDQTTNVDTCAMYGMGKLLDMEDITIETLRSYILEIVNNPRYAENAKKLDELMKDQPQDGLDKAIWWIEYVIRHKGAKHLRSIAVDLPWWQYFLLDVFGFIFTVLLIFLLSVRFTLKLVFRLISYIRKPKEKSMKKKKQ